MELTRSKLPCVYSPGALVKVNLEPGHYRSPFIQNRKNDLHEEDRYQKAANIDERERAVNLGTRTGSQRQGQDAQDEDQLRHQNRTESVDCASHDRLVKGRTFSPEIVDRSYQDDAVLKGDAKRGDEADQGRDTQGLPGQEQSQDAACHGDAHVQQQQRRCGIRSGNQVAGSRSPSILLIWLPQRRASHRLLQNCDSRQRVRVTAL